MAWDQEVPVSRRNENGIPVSVFLDGDPARPFLDGRHELGRIEVIVDVDDAHLVVTVRIKTALTRRGGEDLWGAENQLLTNERLTSLIVVEK